MRCASFGCKVLPLGAKCLLQTENRQNGLIACWLQSIAFWLQSVFFKQKMDRTDLREMANSLYSLVLTLEIRSKSLGETWEWWPWNCPSET